MGRTGGVVRRCGRWCKVGKECDSIEGNIKNDNFYYRMAVFSGRRGWKKRCA